MHMIGTLLQVLQLLSAIAVVVLVLLQHGKGADMGAAFGSGASGSLFGATGSANFLSRSTAVVASVFFVCTLGLSLVSSGKIAATPAGGVMSNLPVAPSAPAGAVAPAPQTPADAGKANEIPK